MNPLGLRGSIDTLTIKRSGKSEDWVRAFAALTLGVYFGKALEGFLRDK